MSDRPTPETNEAQFGTGRVSVDFARRLERQRDEARETLARLRQDLADPPTDVQEAVIDKLCLRSVITERDEARDQLDRICRDGFGYQDTISLEPCADYVLRKIKEERELARELRDALQAVNYIDLSPCNGGSCMVATNADDSLDVIKNRTAPLLTKAKEVLP